jgi:hypothetical protein
VNANRRPIIGIHDAERLVLIQSGCYMATLSNTGIDGSLKRSLTVKKSKIVPLLAVSVLVVALVTAALRRANDVLEGLPSLAGGCGEDSTV